MHTNPVFPSQTALNWLMATSRPREAHLKEKNSSASSAPHHTDTLHGRRTTRPLVPCSSDRDPVRKPMVSPSSTAIPRGRSQTPSSAAAGKRLPVKSPIDKSPSTPNSTLREGTLKSSSSLPRAAFSSKLASNKASKSLKSTKAPPLVKSRSLGATTKRTIGTTTLNRTEPPPATKSEQEEETEIQVEETEPVHVQAILKDDHVPDELDLITDSLGPNIPEDIIDSTSQTGQQVPSSPKGESEIATNDEEVGGDENRADGDKENPKEPEEEPTIESSEEPQSDSAVDSGKPEESEKEKATTMAESSETKRPEVVAFKRPEAAATGRKFLKDGPRSNDVIEEARTKLMVKRKSKVLALVGAFETVISLQEPDDGQTAESPGKSGEEEQGANEGSHAAEEST